MIDVIIPTTNNANQSLNVTLSGLNCVINLYQKDANLYFDLIVEGNILISSRLCQDRTQLIFEQYFVLPGQLFFIDQQGTSNPTYDGLNSRYFLYYRV